MLSFMLSDISFFLKQKKKHALSKKAHSNNNLDDVRTENDSAFLEKSKHALEGLEQLRLQKLQIYEFRKKIAIPVGAILGPICAYIDYWLLLLQSGNDDSLAGLTVLVVGGLYAWATQPKRQYAKEYKKKILPKIAKLFGNLTYDLNGKISTQEMRPSKILPSHDRYRAEDYFSGSYKDVSLQFSEIDLAVKRRSKKRTYYQRVFKGLAILLKIQNKRFYGHTVLDQNKTAIGEWFREKSSSLKRARMADPEFEKIFDTFTNDQVEARYLIDPVMIERLKGLYKEYDGEKMAAAFYDDKMLILIASKHNHFEPAGLHTPATDPKNILNMKKEVGEILSIIDKLSLYDPDKVHAEKTPHKNVKE